MTDPSDVDPRSWLVWAGRPDTDGEPLNVPLIPASTYALGTDRSYSRSEGTPTWEALEEVIGGLEHGRSVLFSSGMAAVSAVFDQLPPKARIVIPDDCYHGAATLAEGGAELGRWTVERLPVTATGAWVDAVATADLIWLESPSNPLLEIADLATICAVSRPPSTLLAVDSTFATPLNQQPLRLGADLSVQSATKFIGGHSDLLAGIASTARDDLLDGLRRSRALHGATPGALETFLALRGVRTLAVRLDVAQHNAAILAERLANHPDVQRTRYPGLADHPGRDLAAAQLGGFGSIVSFDLADGAAADTACRTVRLIQHATSLGAVESTMERRALVHGQDHLPPGLIRLSVGIENVEDLWTDLRHTISS